MIASDIDIKLNGNWYRRVNSIITYKNKKVVDLTKHLVVDKQVVFDAKAKEPQILEIIFIVDFKRAEDIRFFNDLLISTESIYVSIINTTDIKFNNMAIEKMKVTRIPSSIYSRTVNVKFVEIKVDEQLEEYPITEDDTLLDVVDRITDINLDTGEEYGVTSADIEYNWSDAYEIYGLPIVYDDDPNTTENTPSEDIDSWDHITLG